MLTLLAQVPAVILEQWCRYKRGIHPATFTAFPDQIHESQ